MHGAAPPQVEPMLIPALALALALGPGVADTTRIDDPVALEAFVDSIMTSQMEAWLIPGAVVAIVDREGPLLLRGWGVAHAREGGEVDPERTLFDLGSIAKLFTATLAHELVEEGLLDLDTDVNRHLEGFRVQGDPPIALRHLLTHTPGFDERLFLGMVARDGASAELLEENLRRHLPPRIRPPGEVFQYSNAGTTLAGHLAERAAGTDFATLVRVRILDPLGMTRTGYRVEGDLATGHENIPAPMTPQEPWHLNQIPAGGLRSTAADMTRFMEAHLRGDFPGMQATRFTPRPGAAGIALGFMEDLRGGQRGLYHGGQWVGFSSLLYLVPDEGVGIFVAANHGGAITAQPEFVDALLDRWFPEAAEGGPPIAASEAASTVPGLDGRYRWNRQDRHTFFRLPSFLTAHTLEVTVEGAGRLRTVMRPALVPETGWRVSAEDPHLYLSDDGLRRLVFEPGERVHLGWPLLMTLDRARPIDEPAFHLGVMLLLMGVVASAGAWPIMVLLGRLQKVPPPPAPEPIRAARRAGAIAAGATLLFFPLLILAVAVDTVAALQLPLAFRAIFILPVAGLLFTVLLWKRIVSLQRAEGVPVLHRVHLRAVALSLTLLLVAMWHWRLLGFHF